MPNIALTEELVATGLFDAHLYPNGFEQSDLNAARLVIERLHDVYRWLGMVEIDHNQYQDPTGKHTLDVIRLARDVVGSDSPLLPKVIAGIMSHDWGEAVKEPATFSAMLDKAGGEEEYEQAAFSLFDYERKIAVYAISCAYAELAGHTEFAVSDRLAAMEVLLNEAEAHPKQGVDGKLQHPQQVILDYIDNPMNQPPAMFSAEHHAGVARWMEFYDDIEAKPAKQSFEGLVGKTLEKLQGQYFYQDVAGKGDVQAGLEDLRSHDIKGGVKRSEKLVYKLFEKAETEEQQRVARSVASTVYGKLSELALMTQYCVDLKKKSAKTEPNHKPDQRYGKGEVYAAHAESVGTHMHANDNPANAILEQGFPETEEAYHAHMSQVDQALGGLPSLSIWHGLHHDIRTSFDIAVLYKAAALAVKAGKWTPTEDALRDGNDPEDKVRRLINLRNLPEELKGYVDQIEGDLNRYHQNKHVTGLVTDTDFLEALLAVRRRDDDLLYSLWEEQEVAYALAEAAALKSGATDVVAAALAGVISEEARLNATGQLLLNASDLHKKLDGEYGHDLVEAVLQEIHAQQQSRRVA